MSGSLEEETRLTLGQVEQMFQDQYAAYLNGIKSPIDQMGEAIRLHRAAILCDLAKQALLGNQLPLYEVLNGSAIKALRGEDGGSYVNEQGMSEVWVELPDGVIEGLEISTEQLTLIAAWLTNPQALVAKLSQPELPAGTETVPADDGVYEAREARRNGKRRQKTEVLPVEKLPDYLTHWLDQLKADGYTHVGVTEVTEWIAVDEGVEHPYQAKWAQLKRATEALGVKMEKRDSFGEDRWFGSPRSKKSMTIAGTEAVLKWLVGAGKVQIVPNSDSL